MALVQQLTPPELAPRPKQALKRLPQDPLQDPLVVAVQLVPYVAKTLPEAFTAAQKVVVLEMNSLLLFKPSPVDLEHNYHILWILLYMNPSRVPPTHYLACVLLHITKIICQIHGGLRLIVTGACTCLHSSQSLGRMFTVAWG